MTAQPKVTGDEGTSRPSITSDERDLAVAAVVSGLWTLVPVEPTREMLVAYQGALKGYIEAEIAVGRKFRKRKIRWGLGGGVKVPPFEKARARWAAMLAASPDPRANTQDGSS